MKTQRSRNSFDELKRYSGVYQQMGRMFTDSDWNELSDMAKHRLADALTDVIGSGTPRGRGIMKIGKNPDGTETYALQWGYAYVDGIITQLRPDPNATLTDPTGVAFEYEHQADFPSPPALPTGDYTLYLDVWDRTVLSLEDEELRDPGLRGADTCTRTQTMAQVKWCPVTVEPEEADQNPPIGDAELTLELTEGSTDPDPCDPCANEVVLQGKVGNYLFRAEIHSVEYDGLGKPTRVVLKWSSENGAEQHVIGDEPVGFASDNWAYEFYSGESEAFASEKHLGKHLDPTFTPTVGELKKGYPDSVPANSSLVRRWDGFCALDKSGSNWELDEGSDLGVDLSTTSDAADHGHLIEGATVSIKLDVITLTIALDDNKVLAGDFWTKEVREAVNTQGDVLLSAEKPHGILHHYMTLGHMISNVFIAYDSDQCKRFEFPPLTDIWAKDVCYNNDICDMPDVDNVQEAIDYLCQERDLRWHNKHLHGWGIVCGLIAECGPDTHPPADDDATGSGEAERREVAVTKGYALTCKGEDVVLDDLFIFDLIERIEKIEAAGGKVLTDGDGSVCLRIDLGPNGKPVIGVEPYDKDKHDSGILDETLLMDFYEDCILDLVMGITGQFQFLNAEELKVVEGGATGLVSDQRRKFTSFLNLIIQLFNSGNGSYVFLSRKEHLILKEIYLQLRKVLQISTFCGMFQDDKFPDYPFDKIGMTTYFGKNNHSRVKLHPDGVHLYTYGGADNTINRYNVKKQELVDVIEMPSAEGAEVTAITFSSDGELLFAAANVRGIDSVFGVARISNNHAWEQMAILCSLEIIEMQVSSNDPGLIYATGWGRGLFYLRPDVFMDETKPRPVPVYSFNAVGHMAIDEEVGRAYCTSLSSEDNEPDFYDEVAICNLKPDAGGGDMLPPSLRLALIPKASGKQTGSDGLALRPAGADGDNEGARLFVVVDGGKMGKQLLTYERPINTTTQQPIAAIEVEDTVIALAYNEKVDHLLLAMEDGYRLQMIGPNGKSSKVFRVPVQIQPVDLVVDANGGDVYTLNFISNSISLIPAKELLVDDAFLDTLAKYRTDVLKAFFDLFTNLFQYLKDCFCSHLLVKCPSCGEGDVIYLGLVEVRDSKVYKVCNFKKRKYVKTFPAMEYWFSMVPIMPLIKNWVSRFCCSILPDFFGKRRDEFVVMQDPGAGNKMAANNRFRAAATRNTMQTYRRTDLGMLRRNQTKGLRVIGRLAGDNALSYAETGRRREAGVRKQALMQSSVNDAVKELENNNIQVTAVQPYDEKKARTYLADYAATPQRLEPGSKVTLYQRDGKVAFYSVERVADPLITEVPDSLKADLKQLEKRKETLADLSNLKAELAGVEARRAGVAELDAVKRELAGLQSQKSSVEEELAALKSKVDMVKIEREAEAEKLEAINALRGEISTEITTLNRGARELSEMRHEVKAELGTVKRELTGIQTEKASMENELTALKSQVASLKSARELEANKLKEFNVLRGEIAGEIGELTKGVENLGAMRKEIKIEIAKDRPVKEVSGVSAELNDQLREMGIRTVEELSKVSPNKLATTGNVSVAVARRIIASAKRRLVVSSRQ